MRIRIGLTKREYPVAVIERNCPQCRSSTIMIRKEYKQAFTVFFVPILPVYWSKKDICMNCGCKLSKAKKFRNLTQDFLEKGLENLILTSGAGEEPAANQEYGQPPDFGPGQAGPPQDPYNPQ